MRVYGIDPANKQAGIVGVCLDTKTIFLKEIMPNEKLRDYIFMQIHSKDIVSIEYIVSYGMAVGMTVFETCIWTGRFIEILKQKNIDPYFITRPQVKIHLCNSMRAKDKNIRQALIDRWGYHGSGKTGLGTKKDPGPLYGMADDMWAALGVAQTCIDKYIINT